MRLIVLNNNVTRNLNPIELTTAALHTMNSNPDYYLDILHIVTSYMFKESTTNYKNKLQ